VLFDKGVDCFIGASYTAFDVAFVPAENMLLPQPVSQLQVSRIASLPALTNDLIPLFKSPHVFVELLVLPPLLNGSLERI